MLATNSNFLKAADATKCNWRADLAIWLLVCSPYIRVLILQTVTSG